MNKLMAKLTGTENLLVNISVTVTVTFIATCIIALVSNLIVEPSQFASASFGMHY